MAGKGQLANDRMHAIRCHQYPAGIFTVSPGLADQGSNAIGMRDRVLDTGIKMQGNVGIVPHCTCQHLLQVGAVHNEIGQAVAFNRSRAKGYGRDGLA